MACTNSTWIWCLAPWQGFRLGAIGGAIVGLVVGGLIVAVLHLFKKH